MEKKMKKINLILGFLAIILLIVPAVYFTYKNHQDNLWKVVNLHVVEQANRCLNENKCSGNKITINELNNKGYLEVVSNPITKEVINGSSYVDIKTQKFIVIS